MVIKFVAVNLARQETAKIVSANNERSIRIRANAQRSYFAGNKEIIFKSKQGGQVPY